MSVKTAAKLTQKIEALQEDLRRTEAALEGAEQEEANLPPRPGGQHYEDLLAEAATGADVRAELGALEAEREKWDRGTRPKLERIASKRAGLLRRADTIRAEIAEVSKELPTVQAAAVREVAAPYADRYRKAVAEVRETLNLIAAFERAQPELGRRTLQGFFLGVPTMTYLPALSDLLGGGGGLSGVTDVDPWGPAKDRVQKALAAAGLNP